MLTQDIPAQTQSSQPGKESKMDPEPIFEKPISNR